MALKRSEKKALRERVRAFCAELITNAESPGYDITNGMYRDQEDNDEALALIAQEMHLTAKRVNWSGGDA